MQPRDVKKEGRGYFRQDRITEGDLPGLDPPHAISCWNSRIKQVP